MNFIPPLLEKAQAVAQGCTHRGALCESKTYRNVGANYLGHLDVVGVDDCQTKQRRLPATSRMCRWAAIHLCVPQGCNTKRPAQQEEGVKKNDADCLRRSQQPCNSMFPAKRCFSTSNNVVFFCCSQIRFPNPYFDLTQLTHG